MTTSDSPTGTAPSTVHSTARLFALVPCAGVGARSGAAQPKQYERVAGAALVSHTLDALLQVTRLAAVLVVVSPDDEQFSAAVPHFTGPRAWMARAGGAQRAQTVANGLNELLGRGAQPTDWVLVHDAARCLLQPGWVDRLIDACQADDVGGLLALPLSDTLKQERTQRDGRVAATLERSGKWIAQTPQMFRIGLLQRGLAVAGDAVTDESSAIEALGLAPQLVPGDSENLKVTWPGDFVLAERILADRRKAPR
jgi:2-C-methyl-D-erythritol 4-phosphate cytidylyltransferase